MKFFEKDLMPGHFNLPTKMIIQGHIEVEGAGRIEGTVKGDVTIRGRIIIAETAVITGNVIGTEVSVLGVVKGNVIGHKSVHVGPHGEVGGNVVSSIIKIESNSIVKGDIKKVDGSIPKDSVEREHRDKPKAEKLDLKDFRHTSKAEEKSSNWW